MGKHKIKHLSMLSIKSKIYPAICSKLTTGVDEMCMLLKKMVVEHKPTTEYIHIVDAWTYSYITTKIIILVSVKINS